MPSGEIMTYAEDTAVSSDDYVATEKVSGQRVFRQRAKPGNLKVLPTGGSADRTLSAVAAAVEATLVNVATVGGIVFADVAAADTVTAATSNNAFVSFAQSYAIPASTLKAGTVVRVKALVVVNNASGTDTLTCNIRFGGTSLIASTAVDPGATTDLHLLEFELTSRAAASAASSVTGAGRWITNTGGTIAHGTGLLAPSNFATSGALTIDVQAKWSSNTASTSARLEALTVEII